MTLAPRFKQTYVDFVVEEHLPYPLQKSGTWMYFQIEKRNINTMDLLRQIMKLFGFTRKRIGIAGLKDKHALAKQRFCFHANDVKRIGTEKFVADLSTLAKIITTGYAETPLGLGTIITNEFRIRLKYEDHLGSAEKKALEDRFHALTTNGFPNYFGEQRFGFAQVNHRIAQDILDGGRKHFSQSEKSFKLQGYSSRLFNEYLFQRIRKQRTLTALPGDLLMDPLTRENLLLGNDGTVSAVMPWKDKGFFVTALPVVSKKSHPTGSLLTMISGAVIGYNTLMSPPTSQAGLIEQAWVKHFSLTENHLHLYKPYELFGLRRPLWIIPTDASFSRDDRDLLIHITLPKSAYASVFVEELVELQK